MVCFNGVEILDTILNDGFDFGDVAGIAVGGAVALEVKGTDEKAGFGDGDCCEFGYPAAVGSVAVDHGDEALEWLEGIRAPCLSEDFHVVFVEHVGLLVEDLVLFVELLSGEISIRAVFISLVDGVKGHFVCGKMTRK